MLYKSLNNLGNVWAYMNEIALIVNTISKNSDIWDAFFDSIDDYIPKNFFSKKYIFVDPVVTPGFPEDYTVLNYDTSNKYRDQFLQCVNGVQEEYCIYISEDYILYDDIKADKINHFIDILEKDSSISFIRFMRGGIYDGPFEEHSDNLFYLLTDQDYFYTNQAAVWKTNDLKLVHQEGPNLHIANKDWQNSFEYQATKVCQELGMKGLFCYYGEQKRGMYHYDSSVFPHISTALVKGKWNVSEYSKELFKMFKEYEINPYLRGFV